ncbi:MAG: CsbD family protein [Solirubrobacteraceae bacterium MAG38_C4-C5]|nr:CsbD family protein [Candidatus Siliceabacter maunaloa]
MSDLKGKAKEKTGDVTGDENLKREGQGDQAADKVKEGVDKVKDAFKKDR